MDALNSPLDPFAIDYLSYGLLTAVNNIWAWVAFITAAVGLWRIRGLSSSLHRNSEVSALSSLSPEKNPAAMEAVAAAEPATVSSPGVTKHLVPNPLNKTTSCWVLESEGSSKGKFSVYYNDDLTGTDEGGDGEDDVGCNGGGEAAESEELGWRCGDNWERGMVVRMGDMGWYRWQDLKVLDGNVVRLWEGRRRGVALATLVAGGGVAG